MPRYFFNVYDGVAILDDEGSELAGLQEAKREAVTITGQLLHGSLKADIWSGDEWKLVVADDRGRTLFTVRISGETHAV